MYYIKAMYRIRKVDEELFLYETQKSKNKTSYRVHIYIIYTHIYVSIHNTRKYIYINVFDNITQHLPFLHIYSIQYTTTDLCMPYYWDSPQGAKSAETN